MSRLSDDSKEEDVIIWRLDMRKQSPIASINYEKGVEAYLWSSLSFHCSKQYIWTAEQTTTYNIEISEKGSIRQYLSLISEFSEFLSIALFAQQHPNDIRFRSKEDGCYYQFLFKRRLSTNPRGLSLLDYKKIKGKVSDMLFVWHSNHEHVAPIANYLIRSMRYDTPFDAPDFLIIAQALDGYYKRFVNKQDGKDTKQYKHEISKLLKRFHTIEAVRKCNIDSEVLTQSRHKYSHLVPDDDAAVQKAAKGEDLYWLTEKCKVLLTCCVLELLGLNNDEINKCFCSSPISMIINSLPDVF